METVLHLVFLKEDGKKHTVRIGGAARVPEPAAVKALMEYIVTKDLITPKGEHLKAWAEAFVQNTEQAALSLS